MEFLNNRAKEIFLLIFGILLVCIESLSGQNKNVPHLKISEIDTIEILTNLDEIEIYSYKGKRESSSCEKSSKRSKLIYSEIIEIDKEDSLGIHLISDKYFEWDYFDLELRETIDTINLFKITLGIEQCNYILDEYGLEDQKGKGVIQIWEVENNCLRSLLYKSELITFNSNQNLSIIFKPSRLIKKIRIESFYDTPTLLSYNLCIQVNSISELVVCEVIDER